MRSRAYRRHKAHSKMWRRLKEDRNQHYSDLSCPCYQPGKAMARFKEQPKNCQHHMCANQRHAFGCHNLTIQEQRFYCENVHG